MMYFALHISDVKVSGGAESGKVNLQYTPIMKFFSNLKDAMEYGKTNAESEMSIFMLDNLKHLKIATTSQGSVVLSLDYVTKNLESLETYINNCVKS